MSSEEGSAAESAVAAAYRGRTTGAGNYTWDELNGRQILALFPPATDATVTCAAALLTAVATVRPLAVEDWDTVAARLKAAGISDRKPGNLRRKCVLVAPFVQCLRSAAHQLRRFFQMVHMKGDSGEGVGGPTDFAVRAREVNREIMRRQHATTSAIASLSSVKAEMAGGAAAASGSGPGPGKVGAGPAAQLNEKSVEVKMMPPCPSPNELAQEDSEDEGDGTGGDEYMSAESTPSPKPSAGGPTTPSPPPSKARRTQSRVTEEALLSVGSDFKIIASGVQEAQATLRSIASSVALIAASISAPVPPNPK